MKLRFQIQVEELVDRLRLLDSRQQAGIMRRAMRRGLAVLRREMRSRIAGLELAPHVKQSLRRGLRIQVRRRRTMMWAGLRLRRGADEMPLWHWIERGTADRYRELAWELVERYVHRPEVWDPRAKRYRRASSYRVVTTQTTRAAYTGRLKPQPFVIPAIAAGTDEVIDVLEREILAELEATWRASK